jgi:hypothetical protein
MSGTIWEPQPAYGIEIPDITTIVEPASVLYTIQDVSNNPAVAFAYTQQTPSATWTIAHNLNFHPNVTIVDSAGTIVEGEMTYVDQNNMILHFQSAFSGNAYLS